MRPRIQKRLIVFHLCRETDSWGTLLWEEILSKLVGLSSEQVASHEQIINHWTAKPFPHCRRASLLVWFLQSRSFSWQDPGCLLSFYLVAPTVRGRPLHTGFQDCSRPSVGVFPWEYGKALHWTTLCGPENLVHKKALEDLSALISFYASRWGGMGKAVLTLRQHLGMFRYSNMLEW